MPNSPEAVRELAENIDASECFDGRVEYIAGLIAEAVGPLVDKADAARRDLLNCWQADLYANDADALEAEIARWKSQ